MIIPQRQYDIGQDIHNAIKSGLTYRQIHQLYYKDISYDTVIQYHKLYEDISKLINECIANPDFLYNIQLDRRTLDWIATDANTTLISKISNELLISLNTHWRKVTSVEYIQIRHAFAPYKGYPEYHTTTVTKILNYSLTDIISWFNQYNDVCNGLSVRDICNKYAIKHYILQANMRRWLWLGPAIRNAVENDSAIENLPIDSRYYKVLRNNNIRYIEQLESMSDKQLKQLKGIKEAALSLIRTAIKEYKQEF